MPIEFTFSGPNHDIHTRIFGPVRESELLGYLSAVVVHEEYRRGSVALVECNDVRLVDINREAIKRLAHYTKVLESRLAGSTVAVVTSQALVFGLARMYKFLRKPPYRFSVFRSASEAKLWLGRDAT